MSGNVNFIGTQEEWDALVEKNKLRLSAMKKQTAVEWLEIQLKKGIDFNPLDLSGYTKAVDKLFNQSLEIEKEQIESAYRAGHNDCSRGKFADSEKYYNETFGS
jgi:hypothetical protein